MSGAARVSGHTARESSTAAVSSTRNIAGDGAFAAAWSSSALRCGTAIFRALATDTLSLDRGAVPAGASHEAARAGLGFAAVDGGDAEPVFVQNRLLPA